MTQQGQGEDLAPKNPFEGLTYGSYLKVPELLDLQHCLTGDRSHDELLFIVIHQAYELWFKQILFELETVRDRLDHDDFIEARRLLDRVAAIERVLVQQIHLLETMRPRDFCAFRAALHPASGFQSVQFREVEFLTGLKRPSYLRYLAEGSPERAALERRLGEPSLGDALRGALARAGFEIPSELNMDDGDAVREASRALLPIYAEPDTHSAIYQLLEALVAHDQWLLIWRFHHVRVVERVIGSKPGTGGSPGVPYLESTLRHRAFPLLWAARSFLDDSDYFAGYAEGGQSVTGCPLHGGPQE
ncbi:MAG: tryptophan 2,3-dioxygenase [Deltaproteobacteria bacterium]|nr:MAG: tryptophan 2,3-dioxygenase [Deltaproteobacteria bacterium]